MIMVAFHKSRLSTWIPSVTIALTQIHDRNAKKLLYLYSSTSFINPKKRCSWDKYLYKYKVNICYCILIAIK